jgi:hypothetical protein
MNWTSILCAAAAATALGAVGPGFAEATTAGAAPRTFVYSVVHSRYGGIGVYQRTIEDAEGVTRARSKLDITVKMMGMVVHRERDDQTEVWRDGRLVSFSSVSDSQGHQLVVNGQASGGRFQITTPSGVTYAPADLSAADPWGLQHVGAGEVVSIKSGKVNHVVVVGGGTEQITIAGVAMAVRHFSASTETQPDKWDVWVDRAGVPVRFRSREGESTVDFTLVSPAPQAASDPPAQTRRAKGE